jgi:hypothetical protein
MLGSLEGALHATRGSQEFPCIQDHAVGIMCTNAHDDEEDTSMCTDSHHVYLVCGMRA